MQVPDEQNWDQNLQLNNLEYRLKMCFDLFSSFIERQQTAQWDDNHQSTL
jgi:hypothetical protein